MNENNYILEIENLSVNVKGTLNLLNDLNLKSTIRRSTCTFRTKRLGKDFAHDDYNGLFKL